MTKHNVAELLVDVLAEAGVRRMYGVSGDSLNGVTDILAPYPGSLRIPEEPFRVYVRAVLVGLVNNGFKNIIILNGHGPQIPERS